MPRLTKGNQGEIDDSFWREGMVVPGNDMPEFETKDEDLVSIVNSWVEDAKPLASEVLKKAKLNEKYWLGDQLDEKKIKKGRSRIVNNKIFVSMETLGPVAAANIPAPVVALPEVQDPGLEIDYRSETRNLEEMLLAIAQENHLEYLLQEVVTSHQINYLGVIHYKYCEKERTIKLCVEDPRAFLLPANKEEEWVIRRCTATYKKLKEEAGEGKDEEGGKKGLEGLQKALPTNAVITDSSVLFYLHVYTPEFEFKKFNNFIWGKKKNPNWIELGKDEKAKSEDKEVNVNHWRCPKVPFVLTDIWTLQQGRYAQTTLPEQALSLQDSVNARKGQINDNAAHSNGLTVGYGGSGVTQEEVSEIEAKRAVPNSAVLLKKAQQGAVQNMVGRTLDPFVFEDMINSVSELDNVFGTHANLRGERTPGEETKGGRKLLIGSDETRIGTIGKMLDRMAEQIYGAIAQLIRVHFKEAQYASYIGADGASKQVKIDRNLIKEGLKISVRTGSSIRKDKVAQAAQATELWRLGALDPISLFEMLDYPNPLRSAERLMAYKNDPARYVPMVKKDYDQATMADREQEVLSSVTQAMVENNLLSKGQVLAPYQKATVQHLWAHMDVLNNPEFKNLPPEVQNAFKVHIEGELPIVQAKAKADADSAAAQQAERIRILTGPDERS